MKDTIISWPTWLVNYSANLNKLKLFSQAIFLAFVMIMHHYVSLARVMSNFFKVTSKEIVNRNSGAIEKKFHYSIVE